MPDIRRHFVDSEFGQLHVRSIGEVGAQYPLICLHMSPKSGRTFETFMRYAASVSTAQSRLILAPDNPGHGESAFPPAEPEVTIEDYASCAWSVVDAFDLDIVDLLGAHTGSMVAVEMTRQRPDKVGSIGLISAPVFSEKELAELGSTYAPLPLDEEGSRFRLMWERIVHHRGPGMTLEMMAQSLAENLRGGEAYAWGHRAAFAYAPTFNKLIGELPHPISVLNTNDDIYQQTKRSEDLLKNGTFVDRRDWGHGFLDAFPDEAARLILDLLARR